MAAERKFDCCAVCQAPMVYPLGRGKARKYCGKECQNLGNAQRLLAKQYKQCCIDGCTKPATRVGPQLCEQHYCRRWRNGTTEYVGHAIPGNRIHSGGYVLQAAPDHPRALGSYRAYQHRVVFTDAHGEGPFDCHWCGAVLTWGDMHVDHLDDNPENNALTNLVASCPPCNQKRGHEKIRATFRKRYGVTVNGVTRTLNEWAKEVGVSRSSIRARLNAGWTAERAIMEPRGIFGPKRGLAP